MKRRNAIARRKNFDAGYARNAGIGAIIGGLASAAYNALRLPRTMAVFTADEGDATQWGTSVEQFGAASGVAIENLTSSQRALKGIAPGVLVGMLTAVTLTAASRTRR